jgi:hypothetical protein
MLLWEWNGLGSPRDRAAAVADFACEVTPPVGQSAYDQLARFERRAATDLRPGDGELGAKL